MFDSAFRLEILFVVALIFKFFSHTVTYCTVLRYSTYVQAAETEVAQVHSTIGKWCKAHYGEVYSGWVHLKVIRGFIESVLRYGLPLDFLPVFIEPNMKREKQLKIALADAVSNLRPELKKTVDADAEEGEEEDSENLPFVCQKFSVIGGAPEAK